MLPGKKYKPEDILQIARRRIWWILVPFGVIAAVTAVVARKLPDRYRSQSLVLLMPQEVASDLVRPVSAVRLDDQLQTIQQQIESRTRLEQIIDDLNLYPEERRTGIMQDVVEGMIRDINITIAPRGDAFSIAYTSSNRILAQKVAERLTSAFIDESEKSQSAITESTSQFFQTETDQMRERLQHADQALQAYRQKYSGQLPEQLQSNLTSLQNTQIQFQAIVESENRDRGQRLLLQREIADNQPPTNTDGPAPPPPVATDGPPTGSTALQLESYQNQLKAEQVQGWTDARPDVKTTKRMIAQLQAKLNQELLERPVSSDGGVSPAEAQRQKRLTDYQNQLAQVDKQIADQQAEEKRLQGIASDFQHRIEEVPARESEMTDLMRDYGTYQSEYNSLLGKREESSLSATLQHQSGGQRFQLIDTARVPERPISPNRPMINLAGLAGGLGFGVLLVAFLEYRDSSFKADDEIVSLLSVRVLAVVPFMEAVADHRRARRRTWIASVAMAGLVSLCLAVVAYTFIKPAM